MKPTTPFDLLITPTDPTSPAARALIAASDAYQQALYPPESLHLLPPESLLDSYFLGAFRDDELLGCGGYVHKGDYGELKRMYVRPETRGLGIGRRILEALEVHACGVGLTILRLETGVSQPEALALYERAGYCRCEAYGDYQPDPLSVFMEKRFPTGDSR